MRSSCEWTLARRLGLPIGDWVQVINAGDQCLRLGFCRDRSHDSDAESGTRVGAFTRSSPRRLSVPLLFCCGFRTPYAGTNNRNSDILHAFAEFMRSDAVLDFLLQRITGRRPHRPSQTPRATAYHPGDFLTGHDDDVEGKNRETGLCDGADDRNGGSSGEGCCCFHDSRRVKVHGLHVPRFNCLNMFALPVMHSVSQVTAFCGCCALLQ